MRHQIRSTAIDRDLPKAMPRARRGFTLVELMVSVVILSVGLLGLAGTAAAVVRLTAGGAKQTIASSVAAARLEYLNARRCTGRASGTATTRGISESWSVTPIVRASDNVHWLDSISVSVSYRARTNVVRSYTYAEKVPCT
jgi:type IV pilus assembly protein PilV